MAGCRAGSEESYGMMLRQWRLAAGLTQRELAQAGGASLAAIRDLEQGRTRRPRPALAAQLARALQLDGQQAADLLRAGEDRPRSWPDIDGHPASGLRLRILGPVMAWRDGMRLDLGGPRQRAVLGLLAVHHGNGLRRDTIIDVLWGEEPPATAASLVQAYMSRLRRVLDPDRPSRDQGVLVCACARYTLRVTSVQLDLLAFAELASRACAVQAAGDPATACDLFEQALGLWEAEPVADIAVLCQHPAVVGLYRAKAAAIASYADAAFLAGRPERVLPHLHELVCRDPLDEKAHAQLMIALAATGQQGSALRVYRSLTGRLDVQLGVRPSREVVEAHLRVLQQDLPVAAQAAGAAPRATNARGRRPVPRQLPVVTTPFVGRASELRQLSRLLERAAGISQPTAIAAICGSPGVGKTALALHWAHRVANRFSDGQLYADLRGFDPTRAPVPPARTIGRFLGALGAPVNDIPAELDARADLYRSMLASRRLLIVLDNARDAAHVRSLLPGSPGCLVLVTSRSQLSGLVAAEGAWLITLAVLTEAEAADLLALRLGRDWTSNEPAQLTELIRLCGQLPLALSLAAAIGISRPSLRLGSLVAELKDPRHRLDLLDLGDPGTSLLAAFSSSYLSLSAPAARMFRLLGLYSGPDISISAAARLAAIPIERARDALRELARGNLFVEVAPGRFACHELLRAYALRQSERRDAEAERLSAVNRAGGHR